MKTVTPEEGAAKLAGLMFEAGRYAAHRVDARIGDKDVAPHIVQAFVDYECENFAKFRLEGAGPTEDVPLAVHFFRQGLVFEGTELGIFPSAGRGAA